MSSYGFSTAVPYDYDEAVQRTTAALASEGFGILTEIDVKATLRKKLDVDFTRYVILGACNPPMAYRALQAETEIGLLLPCNVIVYETTEGGTTVSLINPMEAMSMVDNPNLHAVATEVTTKLRRVAQLLTQGEPAAA
jgi:uncharacterized protein (DUF302 family)